MSSFDCAVSKFNWDYDVDETIMILEGSIVLERDTMSPTRYGPGDVIFFKRGARAKWHVEGYVRKLAFCRKAQPALFGLASRILFRLKKMLTPAGKRKIGGLALPMKGPAGPYAAVEWPCDSIVITTVSTTGGLSGVA